MAMAAAYRQIRQSWRHTGSRVNRRSAVNTGFHGYFPCDLHRSVRIKDDVKIDLACGTFGFMIAADRHVKNQTNELFSLSEDEANFEKYEAFTGGELVHETHRLALMNAMLHDIGGKIYLGDTLSDAGKAMKNYDVVLTNPPFGTKKGGERATRDDFTYTTSNKQLNFLQHIYRSLRSDTGTARAAVVLPDNVLFADGEGENIRVDLMEKCNLHTILRLPTGIFYAQGVKTNVLFFTRGKTDEDNTGEVWFYDLRTNMPSFGKTNPLKKEHFDGFVAAYTAKDRHSVSDERWSCFTKEQIGAEGKSHSLDLGLIRDNSVLDYNDLPDPLESVEECIGKLEEAVDILKSVEKELKSLEENEMASDKVYSTNEIMDFLLPILKKYKAQKAILFGSYARNEANTDSDIDVMVIGGSLFDPTDIFCIADELNRAVNKNVDVYEENEINHDSAFYNTIKREGIEIA